MATFNNIRPRLPNDLAQAVIFITEYTARRELDMVKPNHYVKKAKAKSDAVKSKLVKDKKIAVSLNQLALLQKLGLA